MNKLSFSVVDFFRHTRVIRDLDFLLESQYWTEDTLKDYQFRKLTTLLDHAYKNVPYYKRIFDEIKLKPGDIKSLSNLELIPILTKEDVKHYNKELVALNSRNFGEWPKSTGGSTGNPLNYMLSYEALSMETANRFRAWSQADFSPGDKIIYFGGPSIIGKKDYKRELYFKLYNFIPISSFNINEHNLKLYLDKIIKSKARLMFSYASSASVLADYILKNKITMKLNAVFTTAEVLFPRDKEKISLAFNCEVFNFYGANDGSISAFECSSHEGLHHAAERSILEIINNGHSVPNGQEGDLISTDLTNFTMPFIRYKVNDRGTVLADKCSCGRTLPLIVEIKGRISDFIICANGEKVHGEFFSHIFSHYNWIEQFQVIQKSASEIIVKLKILTEPVENELIHIKRILKTKFHNSEIKIDIVKNIEKTRSGKHRFIISEIFSDETKVKESI